MTKEETLKAIKVMQDFVDGKTIEWFNEDHWETITDPCWEWDEDNPQYRVKPELHYRPFQSAEEVMEAIKEHGYFIKRPNSSALYNIIRLNQDELSIIDINICGKVNGSDYMSFEQLLNSKWSFADGTPFGKLEE